MTATSSRAVSPARTTPRLYPMMERDTYSLQSHRLSPIPAYKTRSHETAIVIDNGSYQCRAGWADSHAPQLMFENTVVKYAVKGSTGKFEVAVGSVADALTGHEVSRTVVKPPFEQNIVTNYDLMENVLDHVFSHLSITGESVNHPVVLTETYANLNGSRQEMTELLFEGYGVPRLAYGVDALFSYDGFCQAQGNALPDGLIVSCGQYATFVYPVLDGRVQHHAVRRLNIGAFHQTDYMLKLMQLKYPTFPTKMSVEQAQHLVQKFTYCAEEGYWTESTKMASNTDALSERDIVIQFPFDEHIPLRESEEEKLMKLQKREEAARRLREQAAKQRNEKFKQKELELMELNEILASKESDDPDEFYERMRTYGYRNENELQAAVDTLTLTVQRLRNKMLGIEEQEPEKEKPSFPLLEIPDDELNEDELKEKRKQRLLKAGFDARERARKEREEELARQKAAEAEDDAARLADLESWLKTKRAQRQIILDRIQSRIKLRKQLGDRRSAAAQQRMRSIASLAAAADEESTSKKKRKPNPDADDPNDTFGADDNDWLVYKDIRRGTGAGDDSEVEEDDAQQLAQLDSQLANHDPTYLDYAVLGGNTEGAPSLLYRLRHGEPCPANAEPKETMAREFQLHLNVERCRVPEILFDPSIIGLDQAGLIELIHDILKRFTPAEQLRMANNIFVTGGASQCRGLKERLVRELTMLRPCGSALNVQSSTSTPLFDAWRGAAAWAQRHADVSSPVWMTRKQYDEMGAAWFAEHSVSNLRYQTNLE